MRMKLRTLVLGAGFALAAGIQANVASGQTVEEFYSANDITLIVPFDAGGSTAIQSQITADHLARYIPGNPNIRLEFMPGAGGMLAINHAYATSPRDGTVLILAQDSNIVQQPLNDAILYDAREFNWLGSVVKLEYVLGIRKETGVTSIDDLRHKEVFIASTGTGSQNYMFPVLTNAVLGTIMNVVPGYTGGGSDSLVALESGEMQGYASAWTHWNANLHVFDEFIPVLTYGPTRMPDLVDVPTLLELVDDPADQAVVRLFGMIGTLGRGVATMPDVPEDRVAALREAFAEMAADPAFIKDMEDRLGVTITPLLGEDYQEMVAAGLEIDAEVIERARAAIAPKE